MKFSAFLVTTSFAAAALGIACSGGAETPNTSNTANTTTANSASGNSSSLTTTTPTPVSATNDAPTLKPVYKAYCAAFVKGDEAAVRNAWTKDTLVEFEKDMKDSGIKSLIKLLEDDKISNEVCDVKNEIITGDSATADITTQAYPRGFRVVFEKEDGVWKLSTKRPEGSLK